jgi:hypothetical protein
MSANDPKQTLCWPRVGTQQDQSSSMAKAALRSPGFNLRNSVRAFLMFRSDPLSAAACRDGSRMIWATHENQSLRQAPHGCAVERLFFHSRYPQDQFPRLRTMARAAEVDYLTSCEQLSKRRGLIGGGNLVTHIKRAPAEASALAKWRRTRR